MHICLQAKCQFRSLRAKKLTPSLSLSMRTFFKATNFLFVLSLVAALNTSLYIMNRSNKVLISIIIKRMQDKYFRLNPTYELYLPKGALSDFGNDFILRKVVTMGKMKLFYVLLFLLKIHSYTRILNPENKMIFTLARLALFTFCRSAVRGDILHVGNNCYRLFLLSKSEAGTPPCK